jgi:LmbE family N-acetylglucosaminyl deacetylase
MRRAEDSAAVAVLHADAVQLDFLDCIYRNDPATGAPYYVTRADIFGDVDPAEAGWPPVGLAALQAAVDLTPATVVYAPLTVGHHVDHILVQQVARALQAAGHDVRYYTDYPYARFTADIAEPWRAATWQST